MLDIAAEPAPRGRYVDANVASILDDLRDSLIAIVNEDRGALGLMHRALGSLRDRIVEVMNAGALTPRLAAQLYRGIIEAGQGAAPAQSSVATPERRARLRKHRRSAGRRPS